MDWVHPEDKDRQFTLEYNLANGEVMIQELKVPNSGFVAGRFLKPMCLPKPNSCSDNPDLYTPTDFNIGQYYTKHNETVNLFKTDIFLQCD